MRLRLQNASSIARCQCVARRQFVISASLQFLALTGRSVDPPGVNGANLRNLGAPAMRKARLPARQRDRPPRQPTESSPEAGRSTSGRRLGKAPGRARKQARTVGRGSLKRSRRGASARSEIRPLARETRGLNECLRPGAFGGEARGPARAARMSPRCRGRRRDAISLSLRAGTYRIGGNLPLAAGARAAVRRTAR